MKNRKIRAEIRRILNEGPKRFSDLSAYFKDIGVSERTLVNNLNGLKEEGWIIKQQDSGRWISKEWEALHARPQFLNLEERQNYYQHCTVIAKAGFAGLILELSCAFIKNGSYENGKQKLGIVNVHAVGDSEIRDVRWRVGCRQIDLLNQAALEVDSNIKSVMLKWHPALPALDPSIKEKVRIHDKEFREAMIMEQYAEHHLYTGYKDIYSKLLNTRDCQKKLLKVVENIPVEFYINSDRDCPAFGSVNNYAVLPPDQSTKLYNEILVKAEEEYMKSVEDFLSSIQQLRASVIIGKNILEGSCSLCPRERIGSH